MPKALVVLCALLALGVLVAACGGSEEEESGGSSESGPIKIGASLSLTGEASSSAKLVDNGYKMWAEQVNSEGGIEVGGEK
ncbi:MAG TPA: amino acid-binding protein, partial [Polyangia bacterium]|nr:amino acid-binding protein [Polyangia bacterium]